MSTTAFDAALSFVWGFDGAKDDSAPGEAFRTSYGITEGTWADAVADGIVEGAFEDMTRQQATGLYRVRYWNALHCASFDPAVAMVLFSDAVLAGVGHVARLLQRILGVTVDGAIGPRTIGAAAAWKPGVLVNALVDADDVYLASLPGAVRNGRGWARRESELRTAAQAVTGPAVVA